MSCFQIKIPYIYIQVKVKPNAKKNALLGVQNDYLHIAIKSPPIDNAANKELIAYLSKLFKITKADVEFIRGKQAKLKLLKLPFTVEVEKFIKDVTAMP